jgi:mannonate dehydratase
VGLPSELSQHEVVLSALEGIDTHQLWDGHVHLIGSGDSNSGIWVNPHMRSLLHPKQYAQFKFYLNAACANPDKIDDSFLARLLSLHKELPPGARLLLLAFDYTYDEKGNLNKEKSAFHTPNIHTAKIAEQYPQQFKWIASIHPYRKDCVEAVYNAAQKNARAVKWLPPAMGMDPASALCDKFYAALKDCDLPLLVHAGEEKAVHGANKHTFGNPLKLRRPLEQGVRVIVAHCASLGKSLDIDAGDNGKMLPNFALFERLMDEKEYEGSLFGEISAMTQINRVRPALDRLIGRQDWHHRLINASDYPLPAVMPLFSLRKMVAGKYITKPQAIVLGEIRKYNALLFDFLLKRYLRVDGLGLQDIVFASRRLFDRQGPGAQTRVPSRAIAVGQ